MLTLSCKHKIVNKINIFIQMKKTLRLALTALAVVLCATIAPAKDAEVVMGAARTAAYVPLLKGKRIALLLSLIHI